MIIETPIGALAEPEAGRFERLRDRLALLVVVVNETSDELDALWPEALAHEELMGRVVKASHALRRAVIALEGESVIDCRDEGVLRGH